MHTHTLTIDIPESVLLATGQSREEFIREAKFLLAAKLFEMGRLSSGKAAQKSAGCIVSTSSLRLGRWVFRWFSSTRKNSCGSFKMSEAGSVRKTAMISSTSLDLPEHRQQAIDACLRQGIFPRAMEHLPARDADAIRVSLEMVDRADIFTSVSMPGVTATYRTGTTSLSPKWSLTAPLSGAFPSSSLQFTTVTC
jgi:hypothetical protein